MYRIFILLFCAACSPAFSQKNQWQVGGGLGFASYQGDVDKYRINVALRQVGPAVSVFARRSITSYFGIRGSILSATLNGSDKHFDSPLWRVQRGFSFESKIVELSAVGEFYPMAFLWQKNMPAGRLWFNPYLTLGVAGVGFDPKVDWNMGKDGRNPAVHKAQLSLDQQAKFPQVAAAFPLGAGLKIPLGERASLLLEGQFRAALTDYLDGISKTANPESNDWYFTGSMSIAVALGRGRPDGDGDGVPDVEDRCPDEAGSIDARGCPDADGDEVADKLDECPDEAGLRKFKGCPDKDSDGIPDKSDECPENHGLATLKGCPDRNKDGIADDPAIINPGKENATKSPNGNASSAGNNPNTIEKGEKSANNQANSATVPAPDSPTSGEGQANQANENSDRDHDGVLDKLDACPDMPGAKNWNGCPDSDSDGLPDHWDACPGFAGSKSLGGCPDSDGDEVPDNEDDCPKMAGLKSNAGCPEGFRTRIPVPYKLILFDSKQDDWYKTSTITLDEVAKILNAHPNYYIRIEGHTDNTGRKPANQLLSEQRARNCFEYLMKKGIPKERVFVAGFADRRPTVTNDTPYNRQLNRRVEIHFFERD